MKMINKTALVLGALALAASTAMAAPKQVDTLNFSIRSDLTDQGVESGSSGSISGNEVRKSGVVSNQKLTGTLSGLTPNTDYSLVATTSGGTTDLDDFTTDDNGKAKLNVVTTKNGKLPKNAVAFPDGFELVQVTQLDVMNAGAQSVLSTLDTTPTSVKYTIKRDLTGPDGETGQLQINANTKSTKFTLNASGLQPNTDYQLVFNGTPVQTNTSDSKGKLKIKSAPTPTNILDLESVELWDPSNTAVLSTTLP